MNKIIFCTLVALIVPLVSEITAEETKSPDQITFTTTKPKLNKGFNPKFVRILSSDEVKKSNDNEKEKKETTLKKVPKNKLGIGRYSPRHVNSPIQMIYKIDEVPLSKIKPFVASEPYMGPKLRLADGAYPVYYGGAYTNGKFGKSIKFYNLREFRQLFKST
ncbi:uncharacterized protein LOC134835640 [Culicoides brevitarsis]|uniref:uncharacterized protein LOC134835640 n=1 Tax=Culicoides brevitarsis TaxID=469753 RepID=UPI00307C529C